MNTSFSFQPSTYGPVVAELLREARVPELGPGQPNAALAVALKSLTVEKLFGDAKIVDANMAQCCLSGLWLWHDFLAESHTLSQAIETAEGSYWHGIMHRREPDYFNAKYWVRRVGHMPPIFSLLPQEAARLAEAHSCDAPATFLRNGKRWDAAAFIDLCEAIATGRSRSELLARQVARSEWQLLFDHCWRNAAATR